MNPDVVGRAAGDPPEVRFSIVGCGEVTEVKSGPAFQRVPGSSLTAVMRRDAAKAEDYARRHGVPRWTTEAREVIFADDVDAVYVATPPNAHAPYVHMAAEAGKPVYVEKPMGMTLLECETMNDACRRAGVPLFVAYYRRALPRFERVRALIAEGAIGTPRTVRVTLTQPTPEEARTGWRFDPLVAAGGLFVDLGSHTFDLLDHWLGPVTDVSARAVARHPGGRVEDEVSARFSFENGVHGVGVWAFDVPVVQDEVQITGTAGRVSVPMFMDGPVVHVGADGQERREEIAHPAHVQEPLIRQMVDELRGVGGPCVSTGVSAARTQGVLDAVLHEQRRGRVRGS
ncbi:MAG: Gfo/Idh/MocA family oxidoreductase [Trueperaceae bacterium]|nr:Gfo/Idh/MocA family oxidoreductase [Trueperaceae bacterium]